MNFEQFKFWVVKDICFAKNYKDIEKCLGYFKKMARQKYETGKRTWHKRRKR